MAFQLPNRLEFVTIALGALRAGAVCEPLMPIFRERELAFMLGESRARVLFVPREHRGRDHGAMAEGLRATLPRLEHVVVLPDGYGELLDGYGELLRDGGSTVRECRALDRRPLRPAIRSPSCCSRRAPRVSRRALCTATTCWTAPPITTSSTLGWAPTT